MNGTDWCVIEAKHEVTLEDVNVFERKLDYLDHNLRKPWVYKTHTVPNSVIGVMLSVSTPSFKLPEAVLGQKPLGALLVRRGHKFVRHIFKLNIPTNTLTNTFLADTFTFSLYHL
jgi:hypothetical protein